MKILHIISQRPDSTGSGIYLQAILAAASRAGHTNFLLAGLDNNRSVDLIGIDRKNCTFIHFNSDKSRIVGMSDVMPYPSRKFRDLTEGDIDKYLERFEQPIKTTIEKFQPDLLHTHHLWLLSVLVRRLFPDIPMVTSCHGSDLRQFQQCSHLRNRVRSGCREIDSILALTNEQKADIAETYKLPKSKIIVTGAGYNNNLFCYDGTNNRRNNILYAGKISRAKGVYWLLKALKGLKQYPFHLHLAGGGSGEEYDTCLEKAALLGGNITIHGNLPQDQLAKLMQSSQLFILPSLYEGLPLVVLEALASRCRVIATDLPGTREIKKHISGDCLTLIETPVVTDTDLTLLDNENRFVLNLKAAIENVLETSSQPIPDSNLNFFTWGEVFKRIEKSWLTTQNTMSSTLLSK